MPSHATRTTSPYPPADIRNKWHNMLWVGFKNCVAMQLYSWLQLCLLWVLGSTAPCICLPAYLPAWLAGWLAGCLYIDLSNKTNQIKAKQSKSNQIKSINLSIYLSIYLSLSLSLPLSLSLYISLYLPIYLSIFLSIFLSFYLSIFLSFYLSICLSIHPSIHPSIYLSMYLSTVPISISLSLYLSLPIGIDKIIYIDDFYKSRSCICDMFWHSLRHVPLTSLSVWSVSQNMVTTRGAQLHVSFCSVRCHIMSGFCGDLWSMLRCFLSAPVLASSESCFTFSMSSASNAVLVRRLRNAATTTAFSNENRETGKKAKNGSERSS